MTYSIKGFVETSFSDWPGRVVSVLFLPSCNLRCPFCHNHELVRRPETYEDFPWEAILESLGRRKGWIDGVCLTGGEPTLHAWLLPLIRELKSNRNLTSSGEPLAIKLDTNGTHPEVLERLLSEGLLDYVAMDLKAPLEAGRYSALTGVLFSEERMERVRASVRLLLRGNVDYEFRTTVDFSLLIDVLFFNLPDFQDPVCPTTRSDLDCNTAADAVDLNYMIDLLFFNGPPPCDPCL